MHYYVFTEQPYPEAWSPNAETLRVSLPNSLCDPAIAADHYHQHLDEWLLADELGLDIFVNEHHATSTCLTSSANIILGILARQTKRARLLGLGFPIGHRTDPLKVAEELAMIDVISRGRLEMGFVKGVPYEIVPSNTNPTRLQDRFWEAHDLILKAMTSHDGPFTWEGEFFHYRNVNIWPRPYQQPHPPVWISANSASSVANIARRGHVLGTVMTGYKAKDLFATYRRVWRETRPDRPMPLDRLCYASFVGCGNSEREAMARADRVASYLRTNAIVAEQFRGPPGYVSAKDTASIVRRFGAMRVPHFLQTKDGKPIGGFVDASVQDTIDGGLMFAGTPDQVFHQIVDFYETVGGFGHLIIQTHSGDMDFADTVENMTLFAKEVAPRLEEYTASRRIAAE
jgi:alkanesulfonate monooxygenase SsuD/methylene tetrahydromethanopterin reductase-like flavin-dependent oxidoreductase (luciferase family)